jgi:hypothetical protein
MGPVEKVSLSHPITAAESASETLWVFKVNFKLTDEGKYSRIRISLMINL